MKTQNIKTIFIVIILICITKYPICIAQNLVANPSFEIYDTCPCGTNGIHLAAPWYNPGLISSDYYNVCDSPGSLGVPNNSIGYQFANSGGAYAGICCYYYDINHSIRGYIGVELDYSLIQGKKYCVSFYISLSDSSWYAISEIGAYFSKTKIVQTYQAPLPYIPQFVSPKDLILDDKENWRLIEGAFIAEGGEKFITIGNYQDNASIDTTRMGTFAWYTVGAIYYIDDVSVTLCDTASPVVENESLGNGINIYPNPVHDYLNIQFLNEVFENANLRIFDMLGNVVFITTLKNQQTQQIDLSGLAEGMYYLRIESQAGSITKKIVKIDE